MRVATVESSTLVTVAYDETRSLLQLEFCSRAIYLYFGVPPAVHQALLDAPSKGALGALLGKRCYHRAIESLQRFGSQTTARLRDLLNPSAKVKVAGKTMAIGQPGWQHARRRRYRRER